MFFLLFPCLKLAISQNFASSSSGSFIFQSSKNLNGPSSIITPKANNYLTGKCEYSFITIKLAHEIKIKKIEIQNSEWLSNFVTKIKVSILVDSKYVIIGIFDLKLTRNTNSIDIDSKYFSSMLTIEFLEFKGKHNFFTVTSVKVFGTTLIEEFLSMCQKGITNKLGKNCIKSNQGKIVRYTQEKKMKIDPSMKLPKYLFLLFIFCQVLYLFYRFKVL